MPRPAICTRTSLRGQREYDIDLAHTNIIGELMDLSSGKLLPGDVDEVEVGNRLVDRYHSLWSALTGVDTFNPDEMWKIEKRVRRKLNELGFDVDELEVKTAADGTHVLVRRAWSTPGTRPASSCASPVLTCAGEPGPPSAQRP